MTQATASTQTERAVLKELQCPNCGSALQQHIPDAQTIVCPHCHSQVELGGEELNATKGRKLPQPRVPVRVGQRATLEGVDYFVMGRVLYQGWEPGDTSDNWSWNEWLLGANDGRMLWLSHDDEAGFALYKKMRIREPFNPNTDDTIPTGSGQRARVTERYPARIVGAEGELTWRAKRGDQLHMVEGAGNGKKYSIQITPKEIEFYEGEPISNKAIVDAFGGAEWMAQARSSRPAADSPGMGLRRMIGFLCVFFAVAAFIVALGASNTGSVLTSQVVQVSQAQPVATFPVDLNQPQRPVMLRFNTTSSLPENSFADLELSIISPNERETLVSAEEFWHETGVDEGAFWREQDLRDSEAFVPYVAGTHTIKLELGSDPPTQLTRVDSVNVQVDVLGGYMTPNWLYMYAVIVGAIGLVLIFSSGGMRFSTALMIVGIAIMFALVGLGRGILDFFTSMFIAQ